MFVIIILSAHDELGTCQASLVFPKQSVLSILVRSSYAKQLTITYCNIMEIRPRAALGTASLDLTKQKLLRQSITRHPESMT